MTFGVGDAGSPRTGAVPGCVTAPGDPLRGRHLHRAQTITVQWITSSSGLPSSEGPNPPGPAGRPSPRDRAHVNARVNVRGSLRGAARDVNRVLGADPPCRAGLQPRAPEAGSAAAGGRVQGGPACPVTAAPTGPVGRSHGRRAGWSVSLTRTPPQLEPLVAGARLRGYLPPRRARPRLASRVAEDAMRSRATRRRPPAPRPLAEGRRSALCPIVVTP